VSLLLEARAEAPALPGRLITEPAVRVWVWSLGVSLLCVLAAVIVQAVEVSFGVRSWNRLVLLADEFPMRVAGISHYLVALFFLLTGARLRTVTGWMWMGALGVLGAAWSIAFVALGGARNPLCLGAFFLVFFGHVVHDEVFFYREHARQSGRDVRDPGHSLAWIQVAWLALQGALLVPALVTIAYWGGAPWLPAALPDWLQFLRPVRVGRGTPSLMPGGWSFVETCAVLTLPFVLALLVSGWRLAVDRGPGALPRHAPVVAVLAGGVGLVLASAVLGMWTLRLVVLMHFVSWFLFTLLRLRAARGQKPPAPRMGVLAWVRGTVAGFSVFHVGSALLVLGLILLDQSVLGHRATGAVGRSAARPLSMLLGADAFYVWSFVHIALSCMPRSGGGTAGGRLPGGTSPA
jgi:hypothetical protein